eukprot:1195617-Prorocentrum_minimum.AAC.1
MLVTNVVNTQDSQEQVLCATYWFLGLIQVQGFRSGVGGGPREAKWASEGCLQGRHSAVPAGRRRRDRGGR